MHRVGRLRVSVPRVYQLFGRDTAMYVAYVYGIGQPYAYNYMEMASPEHMISAYHNHFLRPLKRAATCLFPVSPFLRWWVIPFSSRTD
eukprot:1157979-Pelagomonas_calceolata.AAC.2